MLKETHVLVVEDDEQTRELLANVLSEEGYQVSVAGDNATALALVAGDGIDVVLSDIKLREESGIALLAEVRARPMPPEVILLTGYASLDTSIAALRTRAFDYLRKPVATAELLETIGRAAQQRSDARRRAAAIQLLAAEVEPPVAGAGREQAGERPSSLEGGRYQQLGKLQFDYFRRAVSLAGAPLYLTPIEYNLLSYLAETPGRVVGSVALVRRTHGYEASASDAQALLRGHVRNLRRKLPEGYLVTVRGNGYLLVAPIG